MVAPLSSSLQAKFHPCPRRQAPATWWFCPELLWTRGTNVSPFLGLFFGLWIIHIDLRFIHSYETNKKSYRTQPKSAQNGLWSKHSITLLINSAERFLTSISSWIIQPTLSWDIATASAITFSVYSSIVQDHGTNGIHVFRNCHLSWSSRTFLVVGAQMSCSKPSNPVLDCGIERALITDVPTHHRKIFEWARF
jgi:hypothetical protein